jgi:hypothetical protein
VTGVAARRIAVKFRCLKPSCPESCGARRNPACFERILFHALLLGLIAVLVMSLAIGFNQISDIADLITVSESAPVAFAEMVHLVGNAANDA